jgi:hypothetical protein
VKRLTSFNSKNGFSDSCRSAGSPAINWTAGSTIPNVPRVGARPGNDPKWEWPASELADEPQHQGLSRKHRIIEGPRACQDDLHTKIRKLWALHP